MSLQRSLIPVARSSRFAIHRGDTVTHRLFATQSGHEYRPRVGLAVASTLGLSLATYCTLAVGTLYADQRPNHELETEQQASYRDEELRALRSRKSVDNFAVGTPQDTEGRLKRYEESHTAPPISGIARYDIAQVARLV